MRYICRFGTKQVVGLSEQKCWAGHPSLKQCRISRGVGFGNNLLNVFEDSSDLTLSQRWLDAIDRSS
jgi:hypothetical protein